MGNPVENKVPAPSAENNNYNNDFGLELILDIPDISIDPAQAQAQDENIVGSSLDPAVSDGENVSSDEGKVGSSLDLDVPDVLVVDDFDASEDQVGSSMDIEGGDNGLHISEWDSL